MHKWIAGWLAWAVVWISPLSAVDVRALMKGFTPTAQEQRAGAAVLRYERAVLLDAKRQAKQTVHVVIAVLDDAAARDYSHFETAFNGFYSAMRLERAVVYTAEGREKRVSSDAVQLKTVPGGFSYNDMKTLQLTLPSVEAGSFVELRFSVDTLKSPIPGEWAMHHLFHFVQSDSGRTRVRIDPVRESLLGIDLPKTVSLRTKTANIAIEPKIVETAQRRTYRWRVEGLGAEKPEGGTAVAQRDIFPRVECSTLGKWKKVNDTFYPLYRRAATAGKGVAALAREVTRGETRSDGKIRAIYRYMQKNIRYVFAHLGNGGLQPHDAETVLGQKYGDCKDQSVLLIALLRAVGIEARPAFVNHGSFQIRGDELPNSWMFSHVIVYLPKQRVWIDTTGPSFMFPGIAHVLENGMAFVLDGGGGTFVRLPDGITASTVRIDIEVTAARNSAVAEIGIALEGEVSQRFKALFAQIPQPKESLRQLCGSLIQNSEIVSFDVENVDNPDAGLVIRYRVRIPREQKKEGMGMGTLMPGFIVMFHPIFQLPSPEQRRYGVDLGARMRMTVTSRYDLGIKPLKMTFIRPPGSFSGKYFDYRFKHDKNEGVVTVRETLVFKEESVAPEAYETFYRRVQRLQNDLRWFFVLEKDRRRAKEAEVELQNGSADADPVTLAQRYFEAGAYEKARGVLEAVIARKEADGEAYYLYGLVLGYLGEIAASSEAFAKAKELGYHP